MQSNSFGELFRITSFGESHGVGVGVVIDGCPSGIPLSIADIQIELDRRKPGQSDLTTPRDEADEAELLSGVFEGKTTGTPIAILVRNKTARSSDYDDVKDKIRPGHADFSYLAKYGVRDYRGGGRASARETAARVAAGAVAKKILSKFNIDIFAYVIQVGDVVAENFDRSFIEKNPIRTADSVKFEAMERVIVNAKEAGDSIGAVVEVIARNVMAGLGEPVFDRVNARLAYAIMSIPAVKGVEFGVGFSAAKMKGSQMNDEITPNGFLTNNAGGTLGGITTGQDIIMRFALKPTSSISIPKKSINLKGEATEVITKGRHDPCVASRAVPIAESMVALTLVDMLLLNSARDIR